MKKDLQELVLENLKSEYKNEYPKKIISNQAKELIKIAENKLRASWKPPPINPRLLAPFRNIQIFEKENLDSPTILEPVTESTFNLYYSPENMDRQNLQIEIAKEIILSFFSPSKKIYDERIKKSQSKSIEILFKLAKIGIPELLLPEKYVKNDLKKLGFNPLTFFSLMQLYELPKDMILERMAKFAPKPCSIVILQFDTSNKKNNENEESAGDIEPLLEKLILSKLQKTDRYRVSSIINSPKFQYKIPLYKSMPPDTIFYHAAIYDKSLEGEFQMKIQNKKVKFNIEVTTLEKPQPQNPYPPLLAFFKEI